MEFEYQPDAASQQHLTDQDVDWLADGGLQVLSALAGNPAMTKQLAIRLGLSRARVQFIIDRLCQRGLASVYKEIHEADRGEIYYAATAKDLNLQLGEQSSRTAQLAGSQIILSTIQEYVTRALTSSSSPPLMTLNLVQGRMNRSQAKEFLLRLEQLAKDFDSIQEESDAEEFALSFALYPVLDPTHGNQ